MSHDERKKRSVAAVASEQRSGPVRRRLSKWRVQRDWPGVVARLLCVLFAMVGLLPLTASLLARLDASHYRRILKACVFYTVLH